MKANADPITVNSVDFPHEIFWLEQFRLAVQTAELACNHCKLLSRYALVGARELMPQQQEKSDE